MVIRGGWPLVNDFVFFLLLFFVVLGSTMLATMKSILCEEGESNRGMRISAAIREYRFI